ncbi:MAG: mechanosensitive ion channel family protein [Lentisphaeria bacterium]|nr:mechanosensitive ion channel family protein [Lentisphaeria bacterium]
MPEMSAKQVLTGEAVLSQIREDIAVSGNYFSLHDTELLQAFSGCAAAGAAAALIILGARLLLKRLPQRPPTWRRRLAEALFPPLTVLAAEVAGFLASLPLIRTFDAGAGSFAVKLFCTVFSATAAWGLLRIVRVIDDDLRRIAEKRSNALDNLTVGIAGSVLKAAIILLTFLFVGQSIFEINISALLASAGVIGLAFALAAKDTVSNFFGTLVIIADMPFRIGDRIECGPVCGIVRSVGMRSSRIVTDDGTLCTVPNSMLTGAAVFKRNRRGHLKRIVDLGLTYDTSPQEMEKAVKILHNIMDDFHGEDLREFTPRIFFSSFGSYALNIRAIIFFKTESFEEEEKLLDELNFAILREFTRAGLRFAFPTQTLLLQSGGNSTDGPPPYRASSSM